MLMMANYKRKKIISMLLVCFCMSISLFNTNNLNLDIYPVNPEAIYHNNIVASQTSGSVLLNMNYNSSDSFMEYSISIIKGNVYNITLNSTGSAIFDVSLVFDVNYTDYVSQINTTVKTDEFLTTCGVPLWGTYNTWDSFILNSASYKGASLTVSNQKNFLIYLDPKLSGTSFNCSFLIIFRSSSNPANNYISIDWNTIDYSVADMDVMYSDDNALSTKSIIPNSFSTINFSTTDNKDLTETVLNETISVDNNLYLIKWVRDLSGNVVRKTTLLSESSTSIYCPKVLNQIINGSDGLIGIALNKNPLSTVTLTWSFTKITDLTINYSELNSSGIDEQNRIRFRPGYYNQAWRTLKIENNSQYFDIEFVDKSGFNQLYWDVQIQFYLIGSSTTPYLLNSYGDNRSEKMRIFTVSQNNEYESTIGTFRKNALKNYQYWFSRFGVISPNPTNYAGTDYMGVVITAIPSLFLLDFNCTVDFTILEIKDLISDAPIPIGCENSLPFGDFDTFQVRKFAFQNYDQFKWSILSENASVLNTVSDLRCNDPNNDRYPRNLNNALISIPINSLGLDGSIYLKFKISTVLQSNDYLRVYIKNSTVQSLIYTYSGTNATNTPNFRITHHSDTNLQIIFNLTTDDNGNGGTGPIIDNVEISNGTHKVFSDNFEYEFNKWNQIDNTGENNNYWRVERAGVTYNSPLLKIIYPNSIYSMTGNEADHWLYSGLYKEEMNFNPYVQTVDQGIETGYIVILPNSNLVQNFTVQIKQEVYGSEAINDGEIITASYLYNEIVFLDGIYQYEVVLLDDFYRYYHISLNPNYRYDITFTINNSPLLAVYTSISSDQGIDWAHNMKNYYGFFMINHTYTIRPSIYENTYFKLDAIAYGTSLTVKLVVTSIQGEFPWTQLLIGILIALNVLSIAWLIKTKKDQKKDKDESSDKPIRSDDLLMEPISGEINKNPLNF
jgi:hypothetical protein